MCKESQEAIAHLNLPHPRSVLDFLKFIKERMAQTVSSLSHHF